LRGFVKPITIFPQWRNITTLPICTSYFYFLFYRQKKPVKTFHFVYPKEPLDSRNYFLSIGLKLTVSSFLKFLPNISVVTFISAWKHKPAVCSNMCGCRYFLAMESMILILTLFSIFVLPKRIIMLNTSNIFY